jgi:5-methylcytosine-specific restriction endonuclease McrA
VLELDPTVRSIESAMVPFRSGDTPAAREHLAALDLTILTKLRSSLLESVSRRPRVPALSVGLRAKRASVQATTKRSVFERDNYTCRLCGRRTIDVEVLRSLSRAFPNELPYDHHWSFTASSPIYWTHTTSLEHVVPIARGGAHDDTNFATSCYACNDARGDYLLEELGWTLRGVSTTPWDGLRGLLATPGPSMKP